jgi:hypothetical protein
VSDCESPKETTLVSPSPLVSCIDLDSNVSDCDSNVSANCTVQRGKQMFMLTHTHTPLP